MNITADLIIEFVEQNPLILKTDTELYKAELHTVFWEEAPYVIKIINESIEELKNEEIREQIFDMATVWAMKIWNETSNLRN